MNKVEIVLGVLVMLFSFLAIWVICSNVTTSTIEPERYAYAPEASGSLLFVALLFFVGIVTIAHGLHRATLLEFGLGIVINLWSAVGGLFLSIGLYDGGIYFKASLRDELIWTSFPLIVFVFLGTALTAHGILAYE
jgi:hypothetical protein